MTNPIKIHLSLLSTLYLLTQQFFGYRTFPEPDQIGSLNSSIYNKTEIIESDLETSSIFFYVGIGFLIGIAVGIIGYFLYRRYSRLKMLRSLYDGQFQDYDAERVPIYNRLSSGTLTPGYGIIDGNDPDKRKFSISNPITLPRPNHDDLLASLQPAPPLPDLNLETEARWQDFHRKKGLAESILQHSTEPPLGRQLRIAVRSCLHWSEVSPESVGLDLSLHPWEALSVKRNGTDQSGFTNRARANNAASLRRTKGGHRHSKSTTSINSTITSLKGNLVDDGYTNHGSVLMHGDSIRARSPSAPAIQNIRNSPALRKKPELSKLGLPIHNRPNQTPLFVEVFSDPEDGKGSDEEESAINALGVGTSNTKPKKTHGERKDLGVPKRPKRSNTLSIVEDSPQKSSLKVEDGMDCKDSQDKTKSVKFDDSAIGGSVLFGHKPKPLPPRILTQPLIDRNFFSAEMTYEWNIPNYGRIRFTDHAPVAFRMIRSSFGYSLKDFDKSLSVPFGSVTTTAGKSESIFFLTNNNARFMFKTLRNSEPDNLKAFLPDYFEHIRRNPNSLLPRYLGMYTYERLSSSSAGREVPSPGVNRSGSNFGHNKGSMSSEEAAVAAAFPLSQQQTLPSNDDAYPQKMVLVLMANVFDTPQTINERYDFKGSNVGRHTLPISCTNVPPTDEEKRQEVSHLTLKDLDFQYRVFQGQTNLIHLGPKSKHEFMAQLEEDLNLLKRFAFMDYSILVGIHRVPKTPHVTNPMLTPISSIRGSRSGSISSLRNNPSPVSSPHTHSSLIQPFFSTASTLLTSILHPGASSPYPKEQDDYFCDDSEECTPKQNKIPFPSTSGITSPYPNDFDLDPDELIWKEGVRSVRLPTTEIYYFGIIDILQKFTIVKWLEKGFKGYNARLLGHGPPTNNVTTPLFTPTAAPQPAPIPPSAPRPSSVDSIDITSSQRTSGIDNNIIPIKSNNDRKASLSLSTSLPHESPFLSTIKYESPEEQDLPPNSPPKLPKSDLNRAVSSPHPKPRRRDMTTPHPTPTTAPPTQPAFPFQQFEFSVEEPGRYAERLLEYMKAIVV